MLWNDREKQKERREREFLWKLKAVSISYIYFVKNEFCLINTEANGIFVTVVFSLHFKNCPNCSKIWLVCVGFYLFFLFFKQLYWAIIGIWFFYIFKVYNLMFSYTYILWNDYHVFFFLKFYWSMKSGNLEKWCRASKNH